MAAPSQLEEVFVWKLIGCVAWFSALAGVGLIKAAIAQQLLGLGSPGALALLVSMASALLVLLTQRMLLASTIVPPPGPRWLVNKGWLSTLIARAVLRYRTATSVLQAALFYASCVASAVVCIWSLQGRDGTAGSLWTAYLGITVGLYYSIGHLLKGADVLHYPIIHRWRYFRIKQRLLPCARQALGTASSAVLLALVLSLAPGLPAPPAAGALLRQWLAAVVACWLWCMSGEVLQVVFTEHVQLSSTSDADAVGPIVAGLRCAGNPIVQDWALLDLTHLAEERGGRRGGRRAQVFAPQPGCAGWQELGSFCIAQLAETSLALKQALPSIAGAAKPGAEAGRAWNVRQVVPGAAQAASDKHALASWQLAAQRQRLTWAVRALAGLAAASLHEDRLGTLLQDRPGLGDVLVALLDLLLALQQHSKAAASWRRRRQASLATWVSSVLQRQQTGAVQQPSGSCADGAAAALLDSVALAVHQLVSTFDGLQGVMDKASQGPCYASMKDLKTLLAAFVADKQ